jgi:glutathione peroxidase
MNYGTKFPRFAKVNVNGPDTAPLFAWLKEQVPKARETKETKAFEEKVKGMVHFDEESAIKWNFGKFLIDREGNVKDRFAPAFKPEELGQEIEKYL